MERSLAWRAEEANLNAWPALQNAIHGDWLIRLASGLSRRANSISPIRESAVNPMAHIRFFADIYASHGLPLIARLPNFLDPSIERAFDRAGFMAEGETCTIYGEMNSVFAAPDRNTGLATTADHNWRAAFNAFHGRTAAQAALHGRIIDLIALPRAFLTTREADQIVCVAFGVLHDGLLCVESVVTAPDQRGKGHAHRMLGALIDWARQHGASGVCLQVEASNMAGRALYSRLGLRTELSRYHYRRQSAG
jgi:GNAT superfamily N-acetyltransferase